VRAEFDADAQTPGLRRELSMLEETKHAFVEEARDMVDETYLTAIQRAVFRDHECGG